MEESQHIKIVGSVFPVLIGDSDITDVDWSIPDVIRLFEHMKSKMETVEKEKEQMQKEIERLNTLLGQQQQQQPTAQDT